MQFSNLNCSVHLLFVSNNLQYSAREFLVHDEHRWVYWTTPGQSHPRVIARLMGCPHWAPQFRSQLLCTCNKSASLAQQPTRSPPPRGMYTTYLKQWYLLKNPVTTNNTSPEQKFQTITPQVFTLQLKTEQRYKLSDIQALLI